MGKTSDKAPGAHRPSVGPLRPAFLATLSMMIVLAIPARAQVRGEPTAIAAAEQLLDRVGGRAAWSGAPHLQVEERVFLATGDTARLRISRDLANTRRRLERLSATDSYVEWLSPDQGWEIRNGDRSDLSPDALAIELQGLRQEPYAVYRRLALRDPLLRVEWREPRSLYVFDRDHLLCWFILDGRGAPTSWGNFWNGAINQHFYGPLVDLGDVNLPRWGVSANGAFRFEYVSASLSEAAVVPDEPSPRP